jgi:SEC-C motif-containing protein
MKKSRHKNDCPCGSGLAFDPCCNRFLSEQETPQTPLDLMRSRYTAYTRQDDRYLRHTWYPNAQPEGSLVADPSIKWMRLQIIRHEENGEDGLVEFIAYCKVNGRAQKMHETSRFLREGGKWYYLDGTFNE